MSNSKLARSKRAWSYAAAKAGGSRSRGAPRETTSQLCSQGWWRNSRCAKSLLRRATARAAEHTATRCPAEEPARVTLAAASNERPTKRPTSYMSCLVSRRRSKHPDAVQVEGKCQHVVGTNKLRVAGHQPGKGALSWAPWYNGTKWP